MTDQFERQLMWSVQALAQPADVQPTLFPPFVVAADELALDFDEWRRAADDRVGVSWSPGQRAALAALDGCLSEMSGPDKAELWLDDGCLHHPRWADVRRLATNVLAAFGWPADVPPPGRAIYVGGRE